MPASWLQSVAEKVLVAQDIGSRAELGVIITSQEMVQQLNQSYLGRDEPTDVLAFSMLPAEGEIRADFPPFIVPPDEIDSMIKDLIISGKLLKKSMKKEGKLPENFQKIKDYFSDENIKTILSGEGDLNELGQKISKTIAYKAPLAIKLANKVIDEGSRLDLKEGLELELSHLSEIFSTKDALEGLNSVVNRQRPAFKGK